MQLADYGSEDEIPSYRLEARNHSASDTYYEPVAVDSSSTLLETLMSQLAEHDLDDTQLTVAQYVIGNLDDNGYLRRDVGSMSYDIESQTGRHVTTRQVREMLDLVRTRPGRSRGCRLARLPADSAETQG